MSPDDGVALHIDRGQALLALGRRGEAIDRYRQALALVPGNTDLRALVGGLLLLEGRPGEAEPELRQALAAAPDHPALHCNLGIALNALGRYAEAETLLRRAQAGLGDSGGLQFQLGLALAGRQDHAAAATAYAEAVRLEPGLAEAWNNLGIARGLLGLHNEAADAYRRALALRPDWLAAHGNLANVLLVLARLDEAEEALRAALRHWPEEANLTSQLAIALLGQGRHGEALAMARDIVARFPDAGRACSAALYVLSCTRDCTPGEYLRAALRFGETTRQGVQAWQEWPCELPGSRPAMLKVGLVSGDLRTHPVGYFLENLLQHTDPARLRFHVYSTRARGDALGARLQQHVASWCDISALDDAAAAAAIRADGIHVLIDLSGHTRLNRLPLFARRPAPLQLSWLGYFASTGLREIDYVLVDSLGQPGEQEAFAEHVAVLPDTRLCFTPPDMAPPVAPLPALANGHITFGSFQNLAKLDDATLALWGRVLRALPDAKLRVQNTEMGRDAARRMLAGRLAQQGVAARRLIFAGARNRYDYLAAHAGVDFILDTAPYTGGTTTCEALWMGVPTLTLRGETLLARQGASLLLAAGLPEWVASDEEDFVARALRAAGDTAALARLRAGMRERLRQSPLCDGARFATNFADTLHSLWHAGIPPARAQGAAP